MERHRTRQELDADIEEIDRSPIDDGALEMIVARPRPGDRMTVDSATVTAASGLIGDNWHDRGSRHTDDGRAEPARQITIMSTRALAAIAPRARWALAGDQLLVDLDLGRANLPTGSLLQIGTATLVVSEEPHTGCAKFRRRFGADAARWVNAEAHSMRRLRGINAAVVDDGVVSVGDVVTVRRPAN